MTDTPSWETLRDQWPNAEASRFVDAAGLRWHVQTLGAGPALLLLHGSGGATHSWRDVAPILARRFTVIAPDLPGHGFTTRPDADRMSLDGIATALRALLQVLDVEPHGMVGHSAGGALALWLGKASPACRIIGINAALAPPNAMMSLLTPGVQLLTRSGLVGMLTAKLADSDFVFDSLMRSTGSTISPAQMALYRAFARSPNHAGAVMSMFAGWDLDRLARELPHIANHVTFIIGQNDGWVPPPDTLRMARLMPHARVVWVPGAGHLAHEEFPARVSTLIEESMQ